MKTKTAPHNVTTATSVSRDFTIKANGKAFRILIDGLYENKIQSIVREIWSNALDSHVEAGCEDRPFVVTFPSMYNPVFTVRDYGTSLSHDDIMRLYTTVFESTKENTNAAVGKFGLGSKSPFAYTDTFSISAFMDGEKRMYTALIAEDGVPQIHFLGVVKTDEERGIEVSFPIRTRDINAFCQAALRVSYGFKVKPIVYTSTDCEQEFQGWPELPVLTEGAGWTLLSGNIEGYISRAYAKMGCVLYPINVDAITDLTSAERHLLQSTVVIEFPVGDLEINASREALSYGPKDPTVTSIRKRIRTIVAEMVSSFVGQYADCKTFWEACVLYKEHMDSGNMPEAVKDRLKRDAKFRGMQLQRHIRIGSEHTSDIIVPGMAGLRLYAISGTKLGNIVYRFNYYSDQAVITASTDTVIYVEDLTLTGKDKVKRVPSKLKQVWMEERFNQLIWIKFYGGKEAFKLLSRIKQHLKGADIRDVADLPELVSPIAVGGKGLRRPAQVRRFHNNHFDNRADLSPDDFTTGGYYVPLERMKPCRPASHSTPEKVWKALRNGGFVNDDAKLYGAPKSLWKRFEGDQWVNIHELAEDCFKRNQPKKKVAKACMIERVLASNNLRYLNDNLIADDLIEGSVAARAVELYQDAAIAKKPAVEHIILLAHTIGKRVVVEGWADADYSELEQLEDNIKTRYPLLDHFHQYYMRREVDILRHYVQVCDKAAALDSMNENGTAAQEAA